MLEGIREGKIKIKICGLKDAATAVAAVEAGADLVGMVFAPSKRQVDINIATEICRAVGSSAEKVGVFVDSPLEEVNRAVELCGLDMVQLHGGESPEYCRSISCRVIKAFRVRGPDVLNHIADYPGVDLLLDSYLEGQAGGTGRNCNWQVAAWVARKYPVYLAGGLTPANVQQAIIAVRPCGLDVSSGVETNGSKDINKIRRFIRLAGEVI